MNQPKTKIKIKTVLNKYASFKSSIKHATSGLVVYYYYNDLLCKSTNWSKYYNNSCIKLVKVLKRYKYIGLVRDNNMLNQFSLTLVSWRNTIETQPWKTLQPNKMRPTEHYYLIMTN